MNTIPEQYRSKTAKQALAHIIEECGEVMAAAGKTLRFGPGSYNPELPADKRETNIAWLAREIDDLRQAISIFEDMCADETTESLFETSK